MRGRLKCCRCLLTSRIITVDHYFCSRRRTWNRNRLSHTWCCKKHHNNSIKHFLHYSFRRLYPIGPSVFVLNLLSIGADWYERYTQKKAWHFFAFIGFLEVLDYLYLPITTSKAHAFYGGSAVALLCEIFWKCPSFKKSRISYFAFSYSMMCISLKALSHRPMFWFIIR